GMYYEWLLDPDAGLRGVLTNWVARRPATLQSKLLVGFLLLVGGFFLVGWVGFAAMEDMHVRLHLLEVRAEWLGHLRTIQVATQAEQALLDEVAAAPRPEAVDRLRQLDAQVQAELAHLLNYPPHPDAFVMHTPYLR